MSALNKIYIGSDINNPLFSFEGNVDIKEVSCVLSSGLLMDELAIDEFSPVVYSTAYIRVRFAPAGASGLITADGNLFLCYPGLGFLDQLPYATPIWYYSDDVLIGKFYCKRVVRSGKTWFDIQAVSAIGVLDGQTHNGDLYAGQTFQEVAADIIGGAVPFSCADDVASIPVFNWLPKASRRSNLHQLLFVYGVTIKKDADGNMVFRFPENGAVKSIPDDRIFVGGAIDYMTPASRVDVTEHAFMRLPSDETVTLFDNTDGSGVADHTTVDFRDAPIHDIEASAGLVVHESGVNHAVLSGTGVLTGRKYTHTTKIISLESGSTGENKTVSVTDATLVSVTNSEYVARRVLSFYSSARTVSADMVVDGERPGDQISFNNPFYDPETAFVASMDIRSSSFLRASCELITNYTPKWFGNMYQEVLEITQSGQVIIPTSYIGRILVVMIGGGDGGTMGTAGLAGGQGSLGSANDGAGGDGGAPGLPGAAGKIFSIALDVKPGQIFTVNIGMRGVGQTASTAAQPGGETTFGSYSSANGLSPANGYAALLNGKVYALPGTSGIPGGKGSGSHGVGPDVEYNGQTYHPGPDGTSSSTGNAGHGGGAAAGSNGGPGGNSDTPDTGDGGAGGHGATPVKPSAPAVPGQGGGAGHGGGGGGGGGGGRSWPGAAGPGGAAGPAGDGADGCILIYHKGGLTWAH